MTSEAPVLGVTSAASEVERARVRADSGLFASTSAYASPRLISSPKLPPQDADDSHLFKASDLDLSGFLSRPTSSPCTSPKLRTSKSFHQRSLFPQVGKSITTIECKVVGPVSPPISKFPTRKAAPADSQPDSPSCWTAVPPPPALTFVSWWNEGQSRTTTLVHFDTLTHECTASIQGALAVQISPPDGSSFQSIDFHVGARLVVLGRRITLRRAANQQTLHWLDGEARALLAMKKVLEEELSKFRNVNKHCGQFNAPQRGEVVEMSLHSHTPSGGRVNLRNLQANVVELMGMLRQHRVRVPPLAGSPTLPEGPSDWSMARVSAEEAAAAAAVTPDNSPPRLERRPPTGPKDYLEWIRSIPLAASAAALNAPKPGTTAGATSGAAAATPADAKARLAKKTASTRVPAAAVPPGGSKPMAFPPL